MISTLLYLSLFLNLLKNSLDHDYRLEFRDQIECVFWNFETKRWSSHGCQLVSVDSSRVKSVCECNHLKYFAVLINRLEKSDYNLIICFSCGISAICLLSTLSIIFSMILKSKSFVLNDINIMLKTRNIITCNLCFFLLITYIFMFFWIHGIDNYSKV
jgi:hypothetical protein